MTTTTKNEIRGWLERAAQHGATHMLVVCDTLDHEDFPVFVHSGEDPRKIAKEYEYDGSNMTRIMEVYDLSMDLEAQLAEGRAFHY